MRTDVLRTSTKALVYAAEALTEAIDSQRYNAWAPELKGTFSMTVLLSQMESESEDRKFAFELASRIVSKRMGKHLMLDSFFQCRSAEKVPFPIHKDVQWRQKALDWHLALVEELHQAAYDMRMKAITAEAAGRFA